MNNCVASYIDMAEGIASLLYPHAEVVIHDLKSQKIAYLANNFSRREVGFPSLLDKSRFTKNEKIIGPYEKLNWDGKQLKSTSIVIRDSSNVAVGLLCINLDISVLGAVQQFIEQFVSGLEEKTQPEILFKDDWQEKINYFVHSWLKKHKIALSALGREDKKTIVKELAEEGAFQGKNAANYVANILNLGRATVYKYLKEIV